MKRIDNLIFIPESFHTDFMIEEYKENKSIILVLNHKGIKVEHKPTDIKLKDITFFKFKHIKLSWHLRYLLFFIDLMKYAKILICSCIKYRPKACYIENTYAAVIVGFMKKLRFCKHVTYVCGDWLGNKNEKRLASKIGSFIFIIADYLACKFNDIIINATNKIIESRIKFWGCNINRNKLENVWNYTFQVKSVPDKIKNKICFLGNTLPDSGLEIVIKSLPKIENELKVIGPDSLLHEDIRNLAARYGVFKKVEFTGYVERNILSEVIADCFCGISLMTNENGFHSYTIPAKIIDYLQFLLPVIATKGIGVMAKVIEDNNLGIVIKPNRDEFIEAINKIHKNQDEYRNNIAKYIKENKWNM